MIRREPCHYLPRRTDFYCHSFVALYDEICSCALAFIRRCMLPQAALIRSTVSHGAHYSHVRCRFSGATWATFLYASLWLLSFRFYVRADRFVPHSASRKCLRCWCGCRFEITDRGPSPWKEFVVMCARDVFWHHLSYWTSHHMQWRNGATTGLCLTFSSHSWPSREQRRTL